jgi:hypothetical protein
MSEGAPQGRRPEERTERAKSARAKSELRGVWLRIPTVLWLLGAGFAIGVLIALH